MDASRSRAFDDLANLLANAAGAVKGVGDEARAVARARAQRMVADLDLVARDEFETKLEVLQSRIAALEAEVEELRAAKPPAKAKTTGKTKG